MENIETLTLLNDFMFGAVMRDPEKCRKLLECILGVRIKKIEYIENQKVVDYLKVDAKGVRLDVYVEDDENTVYDIEMQATSKKELPKRMRYYQGMIDINTLQKSKKYSKLKKSYVIFICDFDLYGKGRHIYTFENRCIEDNSIAFGDEATKIVLSTKGIVDDVNEELKGVLRYIGGEEPTTEFAKELDEAVKKVKSSEEWRREYMTLLMRDNEMQQLGVMIERVNLIRRKNDPMWKNEFIEEFGKDFVDDVIRLIEEHPDWTDKEIASELVEE